MRHTLKMPLHILPYYVSKKQGIAYHITAPHTTWLNKKPV